MNKLTLRIVFGLVILVLFVTQPVRADESITPDEFAARCAAAGGDLTVTHDLRIERGAAEMGACTVTLRASRLEIKDAELSFTGDFAIYGGPDSVVRVDQSVLIESPNSAQPVNLTLSGHWVLVEGSQGSLLDFYGNIFLVGDQGNSGKVRVEHSDLWSISANIAMAASGDGVDGRVEVKESRLFAESGISLQAGDWPNGRRGQVKVENAVVVAWGYIRMRTGPEGKTEVHRNDRTLEMGDVFTGILTMGALTIASGAHGETMVSENPIYAQDSVRISSHGRTAVRQNNFDGSGPILIQGSPCEVRDNSPSVSCSAE